MREIPWGRLFTAKLLVLLLGLAGLLPHGARASAVAQGPGERAASMARLHHDRQTATTPAVLARAELALGTALLQSGKLDEAQAPLESAYSAAPDAPLRAAAALARGHLALLRKHTQQAHNFYHEVVDEPLAVPTDVLAAQINLLRLAPGAQRPAGLAALLPQLAGVAESAQRWSLLLNAGHLAAQSGPAAQPTAYAALEQVRRESQSSPGLRPQVMALDGLAQLYEAQGRWEEVVRLNQAALEAADGLPLAQVQDLRMSAEFRQARAWRQRHQPDQALAAAMRAVEHAQAVRQDLPIETLDGQSTYLSVLQPLLELFVDLQLDALDSLPPARQASALRQVREAVESMRQAEMQDFLGDRCTVEEAEAALLEPGAVALYPVLLPDRIELLVQTRDGLRRVTQAVPRAEVVATTRALAGALRNGSDAYLRAARQLYDWLVWPMEAELAGSHTLVVVPDGPLRLVPFAALHDGQQALLQRVAVATVTGMSMTDATRPGTGAPQVLLAGVAVPGPVVEKISMGNVLRPGPGASAPGLAPAMATRASRSVARALGQRELEARREELSLPGVRDEVAAIAAFTQGKVLLDEAFTLQAFEREAEGGGYRLVHIASHGVFGGSAQSSFILAYDDLLNIRRLQGVLRSEQLQQSPIDLLTLSACETAEGNDRAPLGIAGAAMSARARSVLGTLWPVDDEAAREVMERFYRGLARDGLSKAQALRAAQLELLRKPDTRHPYYWAPFSLIGNWR